MESENEETGLPAFGRYQTFRILGEGAMASVYLAKDPNLSRRVAIKVVKAHLLESESAMTRFRTEASVLANLRHPNILQVYDFDVEDDQHYLVMEFVEGPGFQSLLNDLGGKPLPPRISVYLVYQAALGLAAAHKQGLVHRDIKPDNMLLTSEGVLKISDFGIAHVAQLELTMAGDILGTPFYMAPEQTLAETPVPQTDLWALGVVLYYCLTGQRPFQGGDFSEIKRLIRVGAYRPMAELAGPMDAELVSLVDTLLSQTPEERGTAAMIAARLKRLLDRAGVEDWEAHVRDFLRSVNHPALDRTTVEFQAAATPPLSKSGRKHGSTHRSKKMVELDAEDEKDEKEAPAPEPAIAVPSKWDHYKRMGFAWSMPIIIMVGVQVYSRWNIAHPVVVPQQKAYLQIKSTPVGASIKLDGDDLGMTPMTQPLNPGQYRIKVSHPAFPGKDKDTTIYIGPGIEKVAFHFEK